MQTSTCIKCPETVIKAAGLCGKCYYAKQVAEKGLRRDNPNCTCPCGRPGFTKGYCPACYKREQRTSKSQGRPFNAAPGYTPFAPASVCGCGRPIEAQRKGKCSTCYQAERRAATRNWLESPQVEWLEQLDPEAWKLKEIPEQDQDIEEAFTIYRKLGFPWPVIASQVEKDPVARVQKGVLTVEGNLIKAVSWVGQRSCYVAHPHRLACSYRNNPSVVDAFGDDKALRKAIRYQLKMGDPIGPIRVLRALSALNKGPTNFPPVLARWIVDTYGVQDGVVLDPCAGFGGRLLGVVSSTKNVHYIGRDIEPKTIQGNQNLASTIGLSDRCTLSPMALETEGDWPVSDLIITGPPYYDREDYGGLSTDMVKSYASYQQWVEGFLGTLVKKGLTSAPRMVINVSSFRMGDKKIDLTGDLKAEAIRQGGKIEQVWDWLPSSFGNKGKDGKNKPRLENLVVIAR